MSPLAEVIVAKDSKIEWTGGTWNPIRARRKDTGKVGWHCVPVSPGCAGCYASTFNARGLPACGTGLKYNVASGDLVDMFVDETELLKPLAWRKPRKIFVCSMTDLFADFVTYDMRDRVFAVMALAQQHTFQVLTKRPVNMRVYMDRHGWRDRIDEAIAGMGVQERKEPQYPLENVWLGTTVEDQQRADERIPHLLRTPAAKRFLSVEPMLGPVDLERYLDGIAGIDWVICGGESGVKARPMHPDWARSLRDQCRAAGVPFFLKQWGEWGPPPLLMDATAEHGEKGLFQGRPVRLVESSGRNAKAAGLLREQPIEMKNGCIRLGKKVAGRLLDGVEHSEFPA